MSKLAIDGFSNRGTTDHPFGFIEFNDGLRIAYAPGVRGVDEDGLSQETSQPYLERAQGREPGMLHYKLAREWAKTLNRALVELRELKADAEASLEALREHGILPLPEGEAE